VKPKADRGDIRRVAYGSRTVEYRLVFERRRQLRIDVHPDRRVVVHAPAGKAAADVDARVTRRAAWVLRQVAHFEQFQPLPPPKRYVSGESHHYLGRQYRLKITARPGPPEVRLIGRYFHVFLPHPRDTKTIAERVELWYRRHARAIFAQYTARCVAKLKTEGIVAPEVKTRRMPHRWGSYTRPGTIVLNPELAKAPLACIEYVIMHELCHLKHPDHGRQFHRLLTRCLPDWEKRKARLELATL